MTNIAELRELGAEDLAKRVLDLDDRVFRLRMQQGTGEGDLIGGVIEDPIERGGGEVAGDQMTHPAVRGASRPKSGLREVISAPFRFF